MKLICLLDTCPLTGRGADFRACDFGKGLAGRYGKRCPYFVGQKRIGTVECRHPEAVIADRKTRAVRREVFRTLAPGVGHVIYAGE